MQSLAEAVVRNLAERGWKIAVAEADTGGLIGSLITDVPGSSKVFPGGIIAYGNQPKRELLGIPAELFQAHGAVSEEATAAMAEGARRALHADVGVSQSGIMGPTGGSDSKPIGTVYIACATPEGTTVERHQWTGDREHNKHRTAMAVLELTLRLLEGREP